MKTIYVFLTVAYMATVTTCAGQAEKKPACGIYSSYDDYLHGKTSIVIQPRKGEKIKTDVFLRPKNVIVINNNKKQTLKKQNLYGYEDCSNNNFRFYDDASY